MIYHVAKSGNDNNPGTEKEPFLTISKAAQILVPGDTVLVHAGTYREWVSPANSGEENARITYTSAGDGEVIITGAEPLSGWQNDGDNVWRVDVPDTFFPMRNPFTILVYGDWLFDELKGTHLGDIYLDGKSLYERQSIDEVRNPAPWEPARYPEESLLVWYCENKSGITTIWANFGGKDPNNEKVEINVRPYCFWPEKTGRDHITVSGFTMTQCSPQWAPPTALQEGIIGPHWSKGWIIENNKISESKCCGISLGKEISTGDNEWSNQKYKFGTQREQEVIFRALHTNWSKDEIGSHIVRNNEIFECEQCGIVGHLGCAFSEITGNRIHHIHHKQLYHGAEVSGIKFHASLDVQIHDNIIYSCYRAVWFDWQAQGTHLYRNVFFDNLSEDLFVEVCHGPYTVENNLFLSKMNFRNVAQGGAFVHNLFAGHFVLNPDRGRQTPYHFPHETAVAGYANIMGGDDRFYNNIFLRDDDTNNEPVPMGFFEHLPLRPRTKEDEEAEKKAIMEGLPSKNDAVLYPIGTVCYEKYPDPNDKFWEKPFSPAIFEAHFPCAIEGNVMLNNALATSWENNVCTDADCRIDYSYDSKKGTVHISIENASELAKASCHIVTTETLGKTYHAEMNFEQPDASQFVFDTDFFGNKRDAVSPMPGPFELTGKGTTEFDF